MAIYAIDTFLSGPPCTILADNTCRPLAESSIGRALPAPAFRVGLVGELAEGEMTVVFGEAREIAVPHPMAPFGLSGPASDASAKRSTVVTSSLTKDCSLCERLREGLVAVGVLISDAFGERNKPERLRARLILPNTLPPSVSANVLSLTRAWSLPPATS